jgi:hypothetical protein
MIQLGIPPNIITFNIITKYFLEKNDFKRLTEYYSIIKQFNLNMNDTTINIYIKYFENLKNSKKPSGMKLQEMTEKMKFITIIISHISTNINESERLFEVYKNKYEPDTVLMNQFIKQYLKKGNIEKAESYMNLITKETDPNSMTIDSFIKYYIKIDDEEKIDKYFQMYEYYNIEYNAFIIHKLIHYYLNKKNDLGKSEILIKNIKNPDVLIFKEFFKFFFKTDNIEKIDEYFNIILGLNLNPKKILKKISKYFTSVNNIVKSSEYLKKFRIYLKNENKKLKNL